MLGIFRRALTRRLVVGLDVGSQTTKWALVDVGNSVVVRFGSVSAEGSRKERLHRLMPELPRGVRAISTAVQGQDVAYGYLEVPTVDPNEVALSAQALAQKKIPFPANEVQFSHCAIPCMSGTRNSTGVFYVAARRRDVEEMSIPLQESGLEVRRVELPALALCREFATNQDPSPDSVNMLVHIGSGLTQVVVTRGKFPYYARDFSPAGGDFSYSLQMGLQCSRDQAQEYMANYDFRDRQFSLEPSVTRWLDEVKRSMREFTRRHNLEVGKVYLSGGSAAGHLDKRLEESLGMPVVIDGWNKIVPPAQSHRPELYKLAVGLALEG